MDLINNITHRHSLFYAHLAMVRVCNMDLINNITHRQFILRTLSYGKGATHRLDKQYNT